MDKLRSFIKEVVTTVALAFVLALVIRACAVEAREIPSGSMLPTIHEGDRLLVNKIVYHLREPERGEIIVFDPPVPSEYDFVKRVIGLPGDTVEVKNGKVYVNGVVLEETYISEPPDYDYGPVRVPEDALFVMGDNRNSSYDSHMWETWLRMDEVKGKAFVCYWPLNRMGTLEEEFSLEEK